MAVLLGLGLQPVVASPPNPAAAADPDSPAGSTSRPDTMSALEAARTSGERVEDLSQKGIDRQVFAEPDGTLTAEINSGPVRAKNDEGDWAPIDTSLTTGPDGRLVPKNTPVEVSLSGGGDTAFAKAAATDENAGDDLVWRWTTELPEPTVDGSTATYHDAVPGGGDLVVTATAVGFTHNVVLHEPPAASAPPLQFVVPVTTPDAELKETATGALEIKDTESGQKVATAPAPVMWDGSGTDLIDPRRAPVDTTIVDTPAGGKIVLKPNMDFLTDPDTQYPVTVDPTFSIVTIADTFIDNGGFWTTQSTAGDLRVGTTDSGQTKARSFLKFNGDSTWTGAVIETATLTLRNFASGTCTASSIQAARVTEAWSSLNVNWSTQPTATTDGQAYYAPAAGASGCPSANATWNVTSIVDAWSKAGTPNGHPNYGIRLAAVNEASNNTYRRYRSAEYTDYDGNFRPKLTVNYKLKPDTPTSLGLSPSRGSVTDSSTPTLRATLTDGDSTAITGKFQIYNAANELVASLDSQPVSSGSTASVDVPPDLIDAIDPYTFKVVASDGEFNSAPSVSKSFRFNPALTVIPAPDCLAPCTTITEQQILDQTIPGGSGETVAVTIPGVTPGTIDRAHVTVSVDGWTQEGSIVVTDLDYADIEPSSFPYGSGPGNTAGGTAEVFPAYDHDQIRVDNRGAAAVHVTVKINAWIPVDTSDDEELADAEEYADDAIVDAAAESTEYDYDEVLGTTELVTDDRNRPSFEAAAPSEEAFAPTEETYPCPTEDDPDAECTTTYSLEAPTDEEIQLAKDQLSDAPISDVTGRPNLQAVRAMSPKCFEEFGDWVAHSRYTLCKYTKVTMKWVRISRGDIRVEGRAKEIWQDLLYTTTWDSGTIIQMHRALYTDGTGLGEFVTESGYLWCWSGCEQGGGRAFADSLSKYNKKGAWHTAAYETDVAFDRISYPKIGFNSRTCSNAPPYPCQGLPNPYTHIVTHKQVRCDHKHYIRTINKGARAGCVMPQFVPTLKMSLAGDSPQTAAHIKKAQQRLPGHPGQRPATGLGRPLVRKFWGDEPNLNRREMKRKCRKIPLKGSCDEYPFASTKQGCYYFDNCSVMRIDLADNTAGGRELNSELYVPYRVLDGDAFWVEIGP
jgi:hypothetical protein